MSKQNSYILGIDVGTNSVGWSVVDCEIGNSDKHRGIYAGYHPLRLRALNSRIFQEMVEADRSTPKNLKRRMERGTRNRRRYFKQRRQQLIALLIQGKFLPDDFSCQPEFHLNQIDRDFAQRIVGKSWSTEWSEEDKFHCSPYAMRYFALHQPLEPFELGRLLLHLQRRRGYFSNRGAKYVDLIKLLQLETQQDDAKAADKETGKVLNGIKHLQGALQQQTMGSYIWQQALRLKTVPQRITRYFNTESIEKRDETIMQKVKFFATREMYQQEFEAIIQHQLQYHPEFESIRQVIEDCIFHQRPLQLQKGKVGHCNIYPSKKRCATARLEFQEFRLLQTINNIQLDNNEALSVEQRNWIIQRAQSEAVIKFKSIEKQFGAKCNYSKPSSDDDIKGITGNRTAIAISNIIGADKWQGYTYDQQQQLIEDLITIHDQKALYQRLVNYWGFCSYVQAGSESVALQLVMNLNLEDGYGRHSLKAISKLLKYMRTGDDYTSAMKKIDATHTINEPIFKKPDNIILLAPEQVHNVANPIVQKSLFEIRRVINAVIKRYGMPAIIRVELGRELKSSKIHRTQIQKLQTQNREKNIEAEREIIEAHKTGNYSFGLDQTRSGMFKVSGDDIKKYRMWHFEQNQQCPYCTKEISFNQLFSGGAEVEHILPYTGFAQNYLNTVVSCTDCNREKGARTPYEAWGHDSVKWDAVEAFASKYYTKKNRLLKKRDSILIKNYSAEDMHGFVERQLNDTRYIAKAAKAMLSQYQVPVDVTSGGSTSVLRKRLGLNNILPRNPNKPAYKEDGSNYLLKNDVKSRDDHRHHAIDAFVVALTDRAIIKRLAELNKAEQEQRYSSDRSISKEQRQADCVLRLPDSWQDSENLHQLLLQRLDNTVVSHMSKRKIWGALHEETRYGLGKYQVKLKIDFNRGLFNQLKSLLQTQPFASMGWIKDKDADAEQLEVLSTWLDLTRKQKPADREMPRMNGKIIESIHYWKPMVLVRKDIDGELLSKLSKDWVEGTNTWIADFNIHRSLYDWLQRHQLVNASKQSIDAVLETEYPQILDKRGNPGEVIKRTRIARAYNDSYVLANNATTLLKRGSNHHMVLFNNGKKEGEGRQCQVVMVSMIAAAKRSSQKNPIVCKTAPEHWEGEWYYQLHLFANDMVRWDDESIFTDERTKRNFHESHRYSPYFRVQKMSSQNEKKINICFRHHAVSGTDEKDTWGLLRISSLGNINCTVITPSNLGYKPE